MFWGIHRDGFGARRSVWGARRGTPRRYKDPPPPISLRTGGEKRPPRRPFRMARRPRAYGGQVGGGIFALRRPRPYSRHCGAYCHRPPFTPHGHQRAWREGEETTRHAASLRPPRNGRIGFKPPSSQKGNPAPTDGIVREVVVGACHRHHMRPTGINGHGVKAKRRRGTPRRYVLREMGE